MPGVQSMLGYIWQCNKRAGATAFFGGSRPRRTRIQNIDNA
jgi:hypothetical protein